MAHCKSWRARRRLVLADTACIIINPRNAGMSSRSLYIFKKIVPHQACQLQLSHMSKKIVAPTLMQGKPQNM